MHPHGVIPLHGFLWVSFCDQYLPCLYGYGATTDVAVRLPILRQLLLWVCAGSAERSVCKYQMEQNGKNLYILPGGVAEIFFSRRIGKGKMNSDNVGNYGNSSNKNNQEKKKKKGHVHVVKGKRYGLMKLALQTGAVIVPSYVFGGTEFFDQLATVGMDNVVNDDDDRNGSNKNQNSSLLKGSHYSLIGKVLQSLSRRVKGGLTFYWGQYGTPLPHPVKVTMVLGDPIVPVIGTLGDESNELQESRSKKRTCKKIPNPTPAQVEELMNKYVDALERLFDQYKSQAGYENDILKVI